MRSAIEAGKHVFIEKPVSESSEEIATLHPFAKEKGVNVQVGFNRRFDPDYMRLKSAMDNNEVGQLYMLNISNRDPALQKSEFVKNNGNMILGFTAIFSLELESGAFVQIDNSRETRFGYEQRAELFGSNGSA